MYSIGVDIGGTFTDVFMVDDASGSTWIAKVPSTPPHFGAGFLEGIEAVINASGVQTHEVGRIVHGTTVGTNAILERKGARLGILTTEGFEDILVVGKANRREMYDLLMEPDEPLFLAPRRRIKGVVERIDAKGNVVRPLQADSVAAAVRCLVDEHDIEALVICLLHSYANPAHEAAASQIVRERWPDLPVSVSSEIDPNFRESERLLVTSFDAYVRPRVVDYLSELQTGLAAAGWRAPLQVMQSRGGISGVSNSIERPVGTVLSGPAAGVVGAAQAAVTSGYGDCLTFDMGGTSADVALVQQGRPLIATTSEIDSYALRVPMVDVKTIGAGGGSIAWLDRAGGLRVGPQSAGARPGPVCYGFGGVDPTVTDASLLLGYLDPSSFAGGLELERGSSEVAISEQVATPLGLTVVEAALGIHSIINSRMAQALKMVSIERGVDPRSLALIAFGGAGPVHAYSVAREIGIQQVIVPATPGVYCALGLLGAPIEHGFSRTFQGAADDVDLDAMNRMIETLDAECDRLMARDGVEPQHGDRAHFAAMRYVGQSHELDVALEAPVTPAGVQAAVQAFNELHRRVYSYAKDGEPVEFVGLRSVRTEPVAGPDIRPGGGVSDGAWAMTRHRKACFDRAGGFVETPVHDRGLLPRGTRIDGPAIIQQADTTTVVFPRSSATVDEFGNLVLDVVA